MLVHWIRLSVRLLLRLHALSDPAIKDFSHEFHPLRRRACEVVSDGSVSECDKIVLLVVWRDGEILVHVNTQHNTTPMSTRQEEYVQIPIEARLRSKSYSTCHSCRRTSMKNSHRATRQTMRHWLPATHSTAYQMLCAPCLRAQRECQPRWIPDPAQTQSS